MTQAHPSTSPVSQPKASTRSHPFARALLYGFASIGVLATGLVGVGLVLDYVGFDQTEGGFSPPYTDFTGTPVDWTRADLTSVGFAKRGHVANILVNCSSSVVSFEVFAQRIDWRKMSPRALVVHRPREACLKAGFQPQF